MVFRNKRCAILLIQENRAELILIQRNNRFSEILERIRIEKQTAPETLMTQCKKIKKQPVIIHVPDQWIEKKKLYFPIKLSQKKAIRWIQEKIMIHSAKNNYYDFIHYSKTQGELFTLEREKIAPYLALLKSLKLTCHRIEFFTKPDINLYPKKSTNKKYFFIFFLCIILILFQTLFSKESPRMASKKNQQTISDPWIKDRQMSHGIQNSLSLLLKIMPAGISLQDLTIKKNALTLSGIAQSSAEMAAYFDTLRKTIGKITLKKIEKNPNRFILTLTLNPDPTPTLPPLFTDEELIKALQPTGFRRLIPLSQQQQSLWNMTLFRVDWENQFEEAYQFLTTTHALLRECRIQLIGETIHITANIAIYSK